MVAYVVRRLFYALITFIGITLATFVLIHSVPGDPISFFAGSRGMHASGEVLESIRHEFFLDRPLPEQYARWVRGAITFDFGRSFVDRLPVTQRVLQKLPNTL